MAEPEPEAPVAAEDDAAAVVATVAAPTTAWYDAISVNGFASVAYSFNANSPADDANQLRVFDGDDGSINLDVIELVVQKAAAAPGSAGFRVDLTAGSSIPAAAASAGLFRGDDGVGQDFDVQQGFVSYVGDVGNGLRLDAGKFVTHMGYELIEGYDGYNDHYSRSILFGFAIPFTHTGAKLSYPLSENLTGMVMVANGWDNVKDSNSGKTFGAQLIGTFGKVTGYLNAITGPEQAGDNGDLRSVVDVAAVFAASDAIALGFNADFGHEAGAAGAAGEDAATWMGAALYGKWTASEQVSLALRGEVFDDVDGVRTGTAQTLFEGTLSPAFVLGDNVVLRGDVRLDRSSEASFMTDSAGSKQQLTIALNAIGVM